MFTTKDREIFENTLGITIFGLSRQNDFVNITISILIARTSAIIL